MIYICGEVETRHLMLRKEVSVVRMYDLFMRYCDEAKALENKLAKSTVRQETRNKRLKDLKNRLIPQLQSKIYSQN